MDHLSVIFHDENTTLGSIELTPHGFVIHGDALVMSNILKFAQRPDGIDDEAFLRSWPGRTWGRSIWAELDDPNAVFDPTNPSHVRMFAEKQQALAENREPPSV